VLVLGEALVDRFADGSVVGGAPFNVARSLAAFGVPTTMVTRIGRQDDDGASVLASALRFGLHDGAIQRDDVRPTGVVTVVERDGQHRFHIHDDAAWDHLDLDEALRALAWSSPRIVYFGTLAQRRPTAARAIRALLDRTPALRYLDLNLRAGQDNRDLAAQSLQRADWVKVNDDELRTLLVWFAPALDAATDDDSPTMREGVRLLMGRFALSRLIVTRGDRGYAAYDARARRIAHGAACPVDRVVDTVGVQATPSAPPAWPCCPRGDRSGRRWRPATASPPPSAVSEARCPKMRASSRPGAARSACSPRPGRPCRPFVLPRPSDELRRQAAPVVLADPEHECRLLRHPVQLRPAAEPT
jgi:fructokinase